MPLGQSLLNNKVEGSESSWSMSGSKNADPNKKVSKSATLTARFSPSPGLKRFCGKSTVVSSSPLHANNVWLNRVVFMSSKQPVTTWNAVVTQNALCAFQ